MKGTPEPWVLVAGGFHHKGGMDRANAALATFLASRGHRVHLVAHEVAPALSALEGVTTHIVAKPGGSYFLGDRMLHRQGRAVARAVNAASPNARVVVNGGNCTWPDINWVHSLHHAWPPCDPHAPAWFKAKNRIDKSIARRRELTALRSAKVVIANSERTRRDLVNLLGISESQYSHAVSWLRPRTVAGDAPQRRRSGASMARQTLGPSSGGICRGDWIRHQQGDRHSCLRVEHALLARRLGC